jgi:tRNA (adenine22-N1)-methyltransferase
MELSKRLKFIADHIDKCDSLIDVGTDHGYIPIYAVKKKLCNKAIASDINKGPVEKAKLNASLDGVSSKVEVRLGGGLETVKKGEVEAVVIAGMGGNLIINILEKDKNKLPLYKFMILQPAQNPEVLREYLYTNGYEIIDEDICLDEGIFYELFKVRKSKDIKLSLDPIFYEFSSMLLKKKHPLFYSYLEFKEEKYKKILGLIKEDSESSKARKQEIIDKLKAIESLKIEVSS